MAKKNREPVKPESESSEEETDASSEEVDSDTETALKPNHDTKKPSSSSAVKNPVPSQPDSSSEEDSESDCDSDLEPSKQQKLKPTTTEPPLTPAKRPAEGKKPEAMDSKKPKKKSESEPEKKVAERTNVKKPKKNADSVPDSSKKVMFQRLWSEDDEIVILKEMIEYEAKNNVSPGADMDAFLDYIKKDLHVDVSKTQLQDKIRRLKKKYKNNKGKDRNLTKPHEKAAYELSEKIWGSEKGKEVATALNAKANESAVKRNPSRKDNAVENGEKEAVVEVLNGAPEKKVLVGKRVGYFGLTPEEKLTRIGAELFEGEDEIEGSKEWKKLEREDMEFSLKQLDVERAKMRLVLDTLKKANG